MNPKHFQYMRRHFLTLAWKQRALIRTLQGPFDGLARRKAKGYLQGLLVAADKMERFFPYVVEGFGISETNYIKRRRANAERERLRDEIERMVTP